VQDKANGPKVSRPTILVGVALLAVFLLGFVPQFRAASAARSEVQAAKAELERLRQEVARSQLRDLAALLLYEVAQRNFGLAAQHASALFDRLQEAVASGPDAGSEALRQALAARDAVTAGLASADPAVQAEVGRVFRLVFDATRKP
jgi:hypothetical protein